MIVVMQFQPRNPTQNLQIKTLSDDEFSIKLFIAMDKIQKETLSSDIFTMENIFISNNQVCSHITTISKSKS